MMSIYHGTTATTSRLAFKEGLCPREKSKGNDWGEFPSMSDRVYLTAETPLYYAALSTNDVCDQDKIGAVIQLDFSLLDATKLRPDEDFFFLQNVIPRTLEERKEYHTLCKDKTNQNPEMWKDSLKEVGSVAHLDAVPAKSILGAVFVDFRFYSVLHGALLQVGEKNGDRSLILDVHNALMPWLYSKKKFPPDFLELLIDLAAENLEAPVTQYRLMNESKIRNLRKRDGLSIHTRFES